MKRVTKDICLVGIGAIIGSVITYLIVKTKIEDRCDKEVESVKEAYNKKVEEIEGVKTSINGEIKGDSEIDDGVDETYIKKSISSIANKLNNKPPLTDYSKFFKDAANEDKDDDELAESEHPDDDEPYTDEEDRMQTLDYIDHELNGASREAIATDKPPYVIDRSMYELECDHYDKLDLLYYISDDILCDDDNTEIGRMVLVGTCIEESGFVDNDDETLFVRNDKTMTDFEITKVFTPYEGK